MYMVSKLYVHLLYEVNEITENFQNVYASRPQPRLRRLQTLTARCDALAQAFDTLIPEHYNRVYQANAAKVGVLSVRNARHVVRFYQLMDSLRAETSEGGRLHGGTSDSEPFESASHILREALRTGRFLAVW